MACWVASRDWGVSCRSVGSHENFYKGEGLGSCEALQDNEGTWRSGGEVSWSPPHGHQARLNHSLHRLVCFMLHNFPVQGKLSSELWSPVLAQSVEESGDTSPSLTSGYKALSLGVSGQVSSEVCALSCKWIDIPILLLEGLINALSSNINNVQTTEITPSLSATGIRVITRTLQSKSKER